MSWRSGRSPEAAGTLHQKPLYHDIVYVQRWQHPALRRIKLRQLRERLT